MGWAEPQLLVQVKGWCHGAFPVPVLSPRRTLVPHWAVVMQGFGEDQVCLLVVSPVGL